MAVVVAGETAAAEEVRMCVVVAAALASAAAAAAAAAAAGVLIAVVVWVSGPVFWALRGWRTGSYLETPDFFPTMAVLLGYHCCCYRCHWPNMQIPELILQSFFQSTPRGTRQATPFFPRRHMPYGCGCDGRRAAGGRDRDMW